MFLGQARAVFNSAGIAEAVIGPERSNESWQAKQLVSHTDSVSQTKLDVFRYNTSGPRLDHTDKANNDVSPCDYEIPSGQKLAFRWTGGTPNTAAFCDIDGERNGI